MKRTSSNVSAPSERRSGERRRPTVYATIIPFLAFQLPMIPALIAMENGAYSAEIAETGQPNGALSLFLVYMAVALAAFVTTLLLAPHHAPERPSHHFEKITNVLSFFLLFYYMIPLLIYKPAYLNGMTRYDFSALPYVSFFNVKLYIAILCSYHGWMLVVRRRLAHLVFFILVVLAMVGWGEKFSGVMYAITFFMTGLALSGGFVKKLFLAGVVCIPVALALWALPTWLQDRSDEVVDAFESRLARQGQVFYKVVDEPPLGEKARTLPELFNYFGSYTPQDNGMPYLKGLYIAPDLAEIHEGSFAAGYPAIFLTTGTVSSFLIIFLLEIFRFLMMREVFIVGFSQQKILLIPVYLYFLNYLGKIYESGNTYLLTSPVFFSMLVIILVGNRVTLASRKHMLGYASPVAAH